MVPWWKRLAYGLAGWVVATCVVGILASIWVFTQFPHKRSVTVSDVFDFWLLFLITALAASIFGWLLGTPFVLLVRNSRGWRFWVYLALGSGIGPALLLSSWLYSFLTRSRSGSLTAESPGCFAFCISAAVSSITTLIYLLLLRRAQLAGNQTETLPKQGVP
jgi:hypothetical protein